MEGLTVEIKEIAKLDLERLRWEDAVNTLRRLEVSEDDKVHVDRVLDALQAKIDSIDEALREGDAEL